VTKEAGPSYEDLPEEVKAKLSEEVKQQIKYRSQDRSRYTKDLARLSGFVERGVRSLGSAYVFHHLKKMYPREYLRLKDEHRGQRELL
jgi:hypothetical protein